MGAKNGQKKFSRVFRSIYLFYEKNLVVPSENDYYADDYGFCLSSFSTIFAIEYYNRIVKIFNGNGRNHYCRPMDV